MSRPCPNDDQNVVLTFPYGIFRWTLGPLKSGAMIRPMNSFVALRSTLLALRCILGSEAERNSAITTGKPLWENLRKESSSVFSLQGRAYGSPDDQGSARLEQPYANRSQSHLRAVLRRMAVVRRMLVCPASIFCSVRMLSSAASASCSWVICRAIRSRRRFAPNDLS